MDRSPFKLYLVFVLTLAFSASINAQIETDEFDGPDLSSTWERTVMPERISLNARPGFLRIKGSTVTLEDTEVSAAMVTRPVDLVRFEAETVLSFLPSTKTETAGIDIRRGPRLHYELGIRGDVHGREVYLKYVIGSVRTVAATRKIGNGPVRLKVFAFPKYYRFGYAVNGGEIQYLGGVESFSQSTERTLIALFASGNGRESTVNADFDRFELDASPPDPYAGLVLTDPSLPKGYTIFSVGAAEKGIIEKYPFITRPDGTVPENVRATRGIVYAKYGGREMRLDLFAPVAGGKKRPAVVIVHGGAWITGHHTMENPLAIALAKRGYVAATVEYRLSNETKFPAQIHDLKAAVRWMKANAAQFGIDMDRIGAAGASSGGHLVALLGATNGIRFEGLEGNNSFSSSVRSVVDIDGTATFVDEGNIAKEIKGPWDTNTKLTGFTYAENPEMWKEASPITHVNRSSAPTLFLNSSSFRPFQQREEMAAKLLALGVHSEVVVVPDTPHPFWLFQPWFDITVNNIDSFFKKTMSRR